MSWSAFNLSWRRVVLLGPVLSTGAVVFLSCGASTTTGASVSSAAAPGSAAAGGAGSPTASSVSVASGSASGTEWFASGTVKGKILQGPVSIATVTCRPLSVGGSTGVQVIWGGTIRNTATGTSQQISGDLSFPQLGTWTIPTNDPKTPTASIVVAGNYADRYGLSSGTGGLGTGGLSATATGGTVDATYSTGADSLMLKGSWSCG